jgi:hypothetical protein
LIIENAESLTGFGIFVFILLPFLPLMTRPLRPSPAALVCTFGVVYLLAAKKQY